MSSDITSSGLTHVSKPHEEPNRYRVGALVAQLNYGLITINWDRNPLLVTVKIKGGNDATYLTQGILFQASISFCVTANHYVTLLSGPVSKYSCQSMNEKFPGPVRLSLLVN
jgi:hypothetical protein